MSRSDMIKHIISMCEGIVTSSGEREGNTRAFQVGDLQLKITASLETINMADTRTLRPVLSNRPPGGMSRIVKKEFKRAENRNLLVSTTYIFDLTEREPNDAWKTVIEEGGPASEFWSPNMDDEEIGEVFDLLVEVIEIGKPF